MKFIGMKNGTTPMYKPENVDEAQAFMIFLYSEKCRHLRDVDVIDEDLLALSEAWNLKIPDQEVWTEAGR